MRQSAQGLGMKLLGGHWANGWMLVAAVKPGLAAAQAGVVEGDAILRINGTRPNWTTAAMQLIEGKEQGVKLELQRDALVIMQTGGKKEQMSTAEFVKQSAAGKIQPLLARRIQPSSDPAPQVSPKRHEAA